MDEIIKIKTLLIDNKIDYKEAYEKLKKLPKAHTTKHWKELRKIHLKDKCDNCGSMKPPLYITHTKQPSEFPPVYNKLLIKKVGYDSMRLEVIKKLNEENIIKEYLEENSEYRDSCPYCGLITIRENKGKNVFICSQNHTFQEPKNVLYYATARTTDYEKAKIITLDFLTNYILNKKVKEFKDKFDLEIGRESLLFCIEGSIEYREFKHIKTCCKGCAFIENTYGPNHVLCEKCKIHYHDPIYETCYKCKDEE
jgi:hypothetical protein